MTVAEVPLVGNNIHAGRIVDRGTHAELMESSETYREIVLSQLTEQEAAA